MLAARLEQLNQRVREAMRQFGDLGLGSTLVLVLVHGHQALIAHLGDSRGYLLCNGELEPLTRDHSYLQELVDRGVVSAEEATAASTNGGPNRFLGMAGAARPDILVLDLHEGDRLLLCSDGLTAMLTDDGIRDILLQPSDPQELCQTLVDAANAAGGFDNITAMVIDVGEEP
jgi:PPM family protein phosphatase